MLVSLYVIKLVFQQRKNFVIFAMMECANISVLVMIHGSVEGVHVKIELDIR